MVAPPVVAAGIAVALAPRWVPRLVERWAAAEGFRGMLSREVSKAMKVEGRFAPLELRDWRVRTDSFESVGMPGEAIGLLRVYGIEGQFDPRGVLDRAWRVNWIRAERGRIALRMPDDSKKIVSPKGKPPPWAAIMPDHFECGPIHAKDVLLEFPFHGRTATVSNLSVTATLVGRDFKYHGTNGVLDCPLLPPLRVEDMEILVTRPMIEILGARLRALEPGDPARAAAKVRMGMRDDKSIRADITAERLPFDQAMPEKLRGRVTGRASGRIQWANDADGRNARSGGELRLHDVRLRDIPFLDELARVHSNPDLREFLFQEFACAFRLKDDRFDARRVELVSEGKLRLAGDVGYDLRDQVGEVDVDLLEVPLTAWLPEEIKPRVSAAAWGRLRWKGRPEQIEGSTAEGYLEIDDGQVRNPVRLQGLLRPLGVDVPDAFTVQKMAVHFTYAERVFRAEDFELEAPGLIRVNAKGSWDEGDQLQMEADVGDLDLGRWLPAAWRRHVSGSAEITGRWKAPRLDLDRGTGEATLRLSGARLARHEALDLMARFFKNDGFRRLDFDRASLRCIWDGQVMEVREIDIRSRGRVAVTGGLRVMSGGRLAGTLQVGLTPQSLRQLHGAGEAVFSRRDAGFAWATVKIGGTLRKPTEDLGDRLKAAVRQRPWAMLQLGARAASWWLGDLFGGRRSRR